VFSWHRVSPVSRSLFCIFMFGGYCLLSFLFSVFSWMLVIVFRRFCLRCFHVCWLLYFIILDSVFNVCWLLLLVLLNYFNVCWLLFLVIFVFGVFTIAGYCFLSFLFSVFSWLLVIVFSHFCFRCFLFRAYYPTLLQSIDKKSLDW
jgi:hypothetical protein